jgi:uncharacterized membrane protein
MLYYLCMLKPILLFTLVFLMLPSMAASSMNDLNINIDILDENNVLQILEYTYLENQDENQISYTVQGLKEIINISADGSVLEYDLINDEILIYPSNPFNTIKLELLVEVPIFKSANLYHFFTEFNFEQNITNIQTTINIPKGTTIYSNNFKPSNANIGSDGKKISLTWNQQELQEVFYAVTYEKPKSAFNIWLIISLILVMGIIFGVYYYKKLVDKTILKGFRQDEQQVLEYIRENKKVTQRDIQKKFNYTRSKTTRMIQRFEERELVEKEKYGRTNKLKWKK